MNFFPNRLANNEELSYFSLKIISFSLMIAAITIFVYFFVRGNFQIHYLVATSCLWILFCGILIWLHASMSSFPKTPELTFDKTAKQVKKCGLLALGSFWISGLCFFAGLIVFAQNDSVWRHSIILFAGSILSMVIFVYALVQRKVTRQHYELKRNQQEIIDLLSDLRSRERKDNSNILLA